MIIILITWIMQGILLLASGYWVSRLIAWVVKSTYQPNLIDQMVLGFVGLGALLAILSLFTAISTPVFLMILAFLALGVAVDRHGYRNQLQKLLSYGVNSPNGVRIQLLLLVFITLVFGSGAVRILDTGLYHAQSIQWIEQYPVVPGLGNLHSRFAFNSHFFILQAFFSFSWLFPSGLPVYAVNSFFFWLLLSPLLLRLSADRLKPNQGLAFVILMVACLVVLPRIQSPSPDLISFLLGIHLLWMMVDRDEPWTLAGWCYVSLVVGLLVTIKLSNLPFLLLLWAIPLTKSGKALLYAAIIGTLFALPLFIRNYYLSGYLIYPFPGIDVFTPDWKMPISVAIEESRSIKAWAFIPGLSPDVVLGMPFFSRLMAWFKALDVLYKVLLLVNLIWIFKTALHYLKGKRRFDRLPIVLLINLLFWFVNAPDPRFCLAVLTFNAGYLLNTLKPGLIIERVIRFGVPVWSILVLITAYMTWKWDYTTDVVFHRTLNPAPMETPELRQERGIQITLDPQGRCFQAPLPCACQLNEKLEFRTDKIGDGFKIKK